MSHIPLICPEESLAVNLTVFWIGFQILSKGQIFSQKVFINCAHNVFMCMSMVYLKLSLCDSNILLIGGI